MKSKNWVSTFRIPCFVAIFLLGLTSCAEKSKLQKPPIHLPFDAAQVGSKTTFEVKIVEKNEYLLGVVFSIEKTPGESTRVGKILGMPYQQTSTGQWLELGLPASFRVRIYKQPDNEELLNKIVDHPKTRAGHLGRTADIALIPLNEGIYSITLEYLQGAPELAALPAKIVFSEAHHGK